MRTRETIVIAALTAIYLCFELAFNARLLDVVGGAPSSDQLHQIEVYGRALSGVAVALVVLQLMLARRARSANGRPGLVAIALCCALAGGLVYASLQKLVTHLVDSSSAEFRRTSLNIVLVQRALVSGSAQLDGLDEPTLFSRPEGKAFLALFPVMASSIDRLDEKILGAKTELLARQIGEGLGGPAGYYRKYSEAVEETHAQWVRYQRAPTAASIEGDIERQQDKAWADYLAEIGRRGWTPSSVPFYAQRQVRSKVRAKVAVPADWALNDEATFRDAVAAQVRRRAKAADGVTTSQGRRIPPGLSWPAFFSHGAVQAELTTQLNLPASVQLQAAYSSGSEFESEVFRPAIMRLARQQAQRYDEPAHTFADGKRNASAGLDAARAAIIPPVALFFSLMGAIGHLAKLVMLLVALAATAFTAASGSGRRLRHLWAVPVGVLAVLMAALLALDNAVTRSSLYAYMRGQVLQSQANSQPSAMDAMANRALVGLLHIVAIGQGYGYPINEAVRTRVLAGITYGYTHEPDRDRR